MSNRVASSLFQETLTQPAEENDYRMGSFFIIGNEWNDDIIFFFVFAILRERTIETLTKQNKALCAAKLYNLLDSCFRGQETVLALKQRQHFMNEIITVNQQRGSDELRSRLVDWRQKRMDTSAPVTVARKAVREIKRSNSTPDSLSSRLESGAKQKEKPSKKLLRMLLCEQKQKNQDLEDELRMIKLKLQQELKARQYAYMACHYFFSITQRLKI